MYFNFRKKGPDPPPLLWTGHKPALSLRMQSISTYVHSLSPFTKRSSNPANSKHLYSICTTTAQRLRRWSNIVQMLNKCFVFAGNATYHISSIAVHTPGVLWICNVSYGMCDFIVWENTNVVYFSCDMEICSTHPMDEVDACCILPYHL